jgi:hypothetical protein
MISRTISDVVSEALEELSVTHALFTTYNLDVIFFEIEIIPLLFSKRHSFSNDSRIKELQVREALEESKIIIDLFYDKTMLENNSDGRSFPMMEYGFIGIDHPKGAFHPKIIMVLGKTPTGELKLVIFSGSNNTTKAGWWDNIETINYITLSSATPPSDTLKNEFLEALEYLERHLHNRGHQDYATSEIKKYLKDLKSENRYFSDTYFYFGSVKTSFPNFLNERFANTYRTTQIVSPYFPDNTHSDLHNEINAHNASIYLPGIIKEDVMHAQCSETYFRHLQNRGLSWSNFSDEINNEIIADMPRILHAKLFTFEKLNESWAFAGSVNFTHKAFHDNIEAGFLFKLGLLENILIPCSKDPVSFENSLLEEEKIEKIETEKRLFSIHLLYDWHPDCSKLYGTIEGTTRLTLYDLDRNELCSCNDIKGTEFEIPSNFALKEHFKKSHFVRASNGEVEYDVFVMQKSWEYKPLYYPELTPQQIIHIYTTMSPEKRNAYILQALTMRLIAQGEATEYTDSGDILWEESDFFSEYAEIFYAFRRLKIEITDNKERMNYYLYSERPDSIKALIERMNDSDIDLIVKYLILLSALELYNKNIPELLSNLIEDVRNTIGDKIFLDWFESEFFKEYKRITNEKS